MQVYCELTNPTVPELLWLELSSCTSFIVFENVTATTAVLTLMPKFPEMEYCVSAASMLAEEIWQIAEGFVEVLRKYVGSI